MKHFVTKYEQILEDLKRTEYEWSKYGHDLSVTRVGAYKREMKRLIELGPNRREALARGDRGEVFMLGAEISELLFASDIALDRDHLARSPRIADMFNGPDLAIDREIFSSNLP